MAEGDDSEKTEDPTQKRISDAAKKGQVATSREVANFLMLLVLALNIIWFAPIYVKKVAILLQRFVAEGYDIRIDAGSAQLLLVDSFRDVALLLSLPIAATVIVALASNFMQNGLIISAESIKPKLEKISIFKGLKRLFSLKSMMEFVKGIIKIIIVGFVCYTVIASQTQKLENLASLNVDDILVFLISISTKIVIAACSVMLVIAMMDLLYQRFEHTKSMRMSKQEIKEEYKQAEGDPHIKAKLKQIRQEKAQQRMMSAVPGADVVIRNPTHYAVALQYDSATMAAPMVVAIGMDNIALKIIEIAEENEVPTVTNKPLARALYDSAEIDSEIPLEHYQAVAEIIGYVYRLNGKK